MSLAAYAVDAMYKRAKEVAEMEIMGLELDNPGREKEGKVLARY